MSWNVKYNSANKIMVLTLEGHLNFKEIIEASYTNIEEAKSRNITNFLVDCSLLLVDADRTELFQLPSRFYTKWGMDPSTTIALIEPFETDAKAKVEFYVFATQNLGWSANMFTNRKKALKWLAEE